MKKIILLLFLILFISPVFADDLDDAYSMWDNTNTFDNGFTGQKMITDDQANKVVEKIKEKANENKRKKWWQRKPTEIIPLSPVPETSEIFGFSEMTPILKKVEYFPTIMISAPAKTLDDILIMPGFYKMTNTKEAGNYYILLSQGPTPVAKIKAAQTQSDYAQNEINFGDAVTINNQYIKLIYGNIDLNLEAYLTVQ